MFLLRRGTPCHVRRSPRDLWRPHTCATDRVELAHRVPCNDGPEWAFEADGWELRVAPRFIDRGESFRSAWHIGITGTREGLTESQRTVLRYHLRMWLIYADWHPITFHHGGCVGADREAHELVREFYGKAAWIAIHPASDQPRSLCNWDDADELEQPAKSLDRNKAIVNRISCGSLLLALPKERAEQQRSGTWSTVRYSRKVGKGAMVIGPDAMLPVDGEIRGRE